MASKQKVYDVSYLKPMGEGEDRRWVRIGTAFGSTKKPGRIDVKLDALPLNTNGWDGRLFLFPKKGESDGG